VCIIFDHAGKSRESQEDCGFFGSEIGQIERQFLPWAIIAVAAK
jgi:hypothetical protein